MSSVVKFLNELSREHDDAIPFRVFMDHGLYHPDFGYYSTNIETVGRRGDFSTSATLLPELARSIAGWIQQELKFHRNAGTKINHIIEIGPGDGSLLFNVMRHLNRRVRRTITIHLVEISPKLEVLQRERLAKFGNIHWHHDIASALTAAGHSAAIYSNELVDAFPATAMRHKGKNQWEEICLSFNEKTGLTESFQPLTPTSELSAFSALSCSNFPPNQRIELHSTFHQWIATWLPLLQPGSLLTIDYGATCENLYHRRPMGTLRAYYKQQRFDGPPEIYARFGKQDLTADVNFTDLAAWGEHYGLETIAFQTQAEFTGSLDPAAAAFQVLHQRSQS